MRETIPGKMPRNSGWWALLYALGGAIAIACLFADSRVGVNNVDSVPSVSAAPPSMTESQTQKQYYQTTRRELLGETE